MNAWMFLILAGLCEVGWPLGFKLAHLSENRTLYIFLAILSMGLSGYFLYIAQKTIPMGTAYAVWTGIGAVGAFVTGVMFFGDLFSVGRVLGVSLIIGGVIVLKLTGS